MHRTDSPFCINSLPLITSPKLLYKLILHADPGSIKVVLHQLPPISSVEYEEGDKLRIPPGIAEKPDPLFFVKSFPTVHPVPSVIQLEFKANDLATEQEVAYLVPT